MKSLPLPAPPSLRPSLSPSLLLLLLTLTATAALTPPPPASPTATFEHANKLYEQARFPAAAQTYQLLLQNGAASAPLHFNLGNALFKSGQIGQALYHYRLAEQLAPRDPDLQANLIFARKLVHGGLLAETPWWSRVLTHFTLDEWTLLAAATLWLWLLLLAAREWRPPLKRTLAGYTLTLGGVALLSSLLLASAWFTQCNRRTAIVVVPEAVVRFGPLEESASAFTLRDGYELAVLDEKDGWLQITDPANRPGWLRKEQVLLLTPPKT